MEVASKVIKRKRTKFIQYNSSGELICYKCLLYFPVGNFDISKQNANDFYRESRDKRCKNCKSKQLQKRKENNRGKKDLDRLLLERWHGIKERSKTKGHIIDFDWKYLKELWEKQKGLCAISKIPMTYEMNNGRVSTNLSVDKINCKDFYKKGNIQLVCMAVNQMKSDLTMEKLIFFCKEVIKNYKHG